MSLPYNVNEKKEVTSMFSENVKILKELAGGDA